MTFTPDGGQEQIDRPYLGCSRPEEAVPSHCHSTLNEHWSGKRNRTYQNVYPGIAGSPKEGGGADTIAIHGRCPRRRVGQIANAYEFLRYQCPRAMSTKNPRTIFGWISTIRALGCHGRLVRTSHPWHPKTTAKRPIVPNAVNAVDPTDAPFHRNFPTTPAVRPARWPPRSPWPGVPEIAPIPCRSPRRIAGRCYRRRP